MERKRENKKNKKDRQQIRQAIAKHYNVDECTTKMLQLERQGKVSATSRVNKRQPETNFDFLNFYCQDFEHTWKISLIALLSSKERYL